MILKNVKFGEVENVIGIVFGNGTLSVVNGSHDDGSKSLLIKSKEFTPIGEISGSEKSSDEFNPEVAIRFLNKESFDVFFEFVMNIKNEYEPINKVNDVEGKNLKCEGSCEEHNGIVRKVKVIGLGFEDGMDFNYCEEAIKEDLRRGFLVEIL